MFDFLKPKAKPVDHLAELIRGDDPFAWTFQTLTGVKRKGDLEHLIALMGHEEAAGIVNQVLSTQHCVRAVARDCRENDVDYDFLPDHLKAFLAFPFFRAGLVEQAQRLVDSIKSTQTLSDRALIEAYFMEQSYLLSDALLVRVAENNDVLAEMDLILKRMQAELKTVTTPSAKVADLHQDIINSIQDYSPATKFASGIELMEKIAGYPHPIPTLRDKALAQYLQGSNPVRELGLSVIGALNNNPNPGVVYEKDPSGGARRGYLSLARQFNAYHMDNENSAILGGIRDFSRVYLKASNAKTVQLSMAELRSIEKCCRDALSMKFTPLQFNILLEHTRLLTSDLEPLATLRDKPIERLLALTPLMALEGVAKNNDPSLRRMLQDFAARVVEKYQITPQKLAAKVDSDGAALLVGKLIDSDLLKSEGSETLLTWKLEAEMGL
jgi:hypothetical protein